MGKKSHDKASKAKLTKKEKKAQNHLKLIQGKKGNSTSSFEDTKLDDKKKVA